MYEDLSEPTIFSPLAEKLGTSEQALLLTLTLLMGYPLGLFHHKFLYGKSPNLQHLFFAVVGIILSYYNYGVDVEHSLICILVLYVVLRICGGSPISVGITLIFFMAYLLTAYSTTASKDYDIKWTLLHCVLTLRLIALAFDVYDGTKKFEHLSEDQKKTALHRTPTLLEIAGYCYFFGGFMVGPQFSMTRYLSFVHQKLPLNAFSGKPSCYFAAVSKLFLGLIVLGTYQFGSTLIPEKYILTDEFEEKHFFYKMILLGLWGKICLYKYVACWLLSEGSCILTGLTYNGEDKKGNILWNGCSNVDILGLELTITFSGIIQTFNINTNQWVAQYIYKRCKFLGNKLLSQIFALLFLALWHGLHSGYYVCFFNEFIVIKMERDIQDIIERSPLLERFLSCLKIPLYFVLKVYVTCFLGYCVVPFVLLTIDRWYQVYASVYFVGHVIYLSWPVIYFFVSLGFRRSQSRESASNIENDQNH